MTPGATPTSTRCRASMANSICRAMVPTAKRALAPIRPCGTGSRSDWHQGTNEPDEPDCGRKRGSKRDPVISGEKPAGRAPENNRHKREQGGEKDDGRKCSPRQP